MNQVLALFNTNDSPLELLIDILIVVLIVVLIIWLLRMAGVIK